MILENVPTPLERWALGWGVGALGRRGQPNANAIFEFCPYANPTPTGKFQFCPNPTLTLRKFCPNLQPWSDASSHITSNCRIILTIKHKTWVCYLKEALVKFPQPKQLTHNF